MPLCGTIRSMKKSNTEGFVDISLGPRPGSILSGSEYTEK